MSLSPDLLTITKSAASLANDLLEVEFECAFPIVTVAPITVNWPQNAKGKATAIIEKSGNIIEEFQFTGSLKKELTSFVPALSPGDILSISIIHRSWNMSPTVTKLNVTVR